MQDVPHVAGAVFDAQLPLHSWNALVHALLQLPPVQEAVAFARVGHAVHAAPHAVTSLSPLQAFPHAWKLASHDALHVPVSHVTVPFAGFAQSLSVRQPFLQVRVLALQKRP